MANALNQTEKDRKQLLRGVSPLVGGLAPDAALETMDDGSVKALLSHARSVIDANVKPASKSSGGWLSWFRQTPPEESKGLKDRVRETAEKAAEGKTPLSADERQSLQSVMGLAGYDVELDDTISESEQNQLPSFINTLKSNITLESSFNAQARNAQEKIDSAKRAEAEAALTAEREKARITAEGEVKSQFSGGLVYAGFLDPKNVNDKNAVAAAMNQMIANRVHPAEMADEQESIFPGGKWEPSEYGLTFLRRQLAGKTALITNDKGVTGDRLLDDLQSQDPERIKLAQRFLNLMGADDVAPTGKYDMPTHQAAAQEVNKPLTVPEGAFIDGKMNHLVVYDLAVRGQLYLPMDKLTPEQQKAAMALPLAKDRAPDAFMSREGFIAGILLKDEKTYKSVLEEENTRRAAVKLEAPTAAMERENVASTVSQTQNALSAVALPENFTQVVAQHASKSNGLIRIDEIPALLARSKNSELSLSASIMEAGNTAQLAGISPDTLTKNIAINPADPSFQANMVDVLKHAYVMENARAGMRMDSIPAETLKSFQDIAGKQGEVSNSFSQRGLESVGLPPNFMTHLASLGDQSGGKISLIQLPQVLNIMEKDVSGLRYNASNYGSYVFASGIHDIAGQKDAPAEIRNIAGSEEINLKDPKQLAVAIQISSAIHQNASLEDLRKNPEFIAVTEAAAKGYLGAGPKDPAQNAPAKDAPANEGAPVSSKDDPQRVSIITPFGAAASPNQPSAKPESPVFVPERRDGPTVTLG